MKLGPALSLQALPPALAGYQAAVDPRPLLLERGWVEALLHLHKLLLQALQALLQQESTADFLQISGKARDQLRQAARIPLQLGCLRPDFLVDSQGRPWICEINARFPVNGFLLSATLSDQFGRALPAYSCACDGNRIRHHLQLPAGSFIVKRREPGWDIHQLSLDQQAPIVADLPTAASQLVLELHQDELLELPSLPTQPYFNDVRSQWLGHDKRLLELLGQPQVLEPWLGAQAPTLSQAIVPTRSLGSVRNVSQSGVLKPNRSGKGEGLVWGRDLSPEQWQDRLDQAPSEWVVQSEIESRLLGQEYLVGTLLSKDQVSLGLGIFRASPQPVVNVSGGGRVLYPMIDGT
jgi:hypothetical protein